MKNELSICLCFTERSIEIVLLIGHYEIFKQLYRSIPEMWKLILFKNL
ncbi:hypothetical protein LEP1GSC021_2884 [Leptospira noguchii str. 1993005606]|nr:hypothetical protein LEP1GSC021_2884 [Leptospira noguchii str. 1993005606]